ncbi:trypsin-like peptidase domain-containing protein [Streptomyces sp. ISL-96]|uniref:VMAP-C domain-containing protein n=1 Tax=Streptomyces sp. ISL-96 TaxID=2819191 RepID=UPI001BEBC5CB|nr:trypsin-like peptidase domain-containing protein [Streptomyces sp. ISL-96]MBT2491290.1 trypsin-like peptidase domain-containing protein [Streptomyces sp. ISL-96]
MNAFDEIVRPSLVRIAAPGAGYDPHGTHYWGSGFFIAPGWVLTCAHVVGKGEAAVWRGERALGITWQGGVTTGEVVLAKPRPADPDEPPYRWEFPDIALVRVPDAQDAACVWLSERPLDIPADVSLHGWSRETGDLGIRHGVGQAHATDGKALLLRGSLPVEGCSGGPVVDLKHGAVIGMNKGRGEHEGAAVPITALRELHDLRGGGILHTVLREHDRHHLRRFRSTSAAGGGWTKAQADLRKGAPGFLPAARAHLFGRFAELPPPTGPGEVMVLVDDVKRRVLHRDYQSPIEHDPRTWRDGVGLLHDLRGRDGGHDLDVDAVLLYAAKVVRHLAEQGRSRARADGPQRAALGELGELGEWITTQGESAHQAIREEIAQVLDFGEAASPAPEFAFHSVRERPSGHARADVLVEIDPVHYGDRYPWRVKLLYDGRTVSPLSGDDRGVRRADLRETLREPLADALRRGDSGEHLAAVEALLPRELFDEPLDTWRLSPEDDLFDEHSMALGERRIVVIRDRRRRDRPASPEWRRRWQAAVRGPLTVVPLRGEVPASGHGPGARRESRRATYARLSDAGNGTVPVYCGPVGSGDGLDAMAAAIAAGHPLALWRRGGQDHSDCREFHVRADELLARADGVDGLHRHIRSLRIISMDPDATPDMVSEAAWAASVAVLFDPPDRPPYDGVPLHAPPKLSGPSA